MKLIFLDIDGVLNSQLWYVKRSKGETSTHDDTATKAQGQLDPNSIKYLNSLIEQTGAKVVVTSTWRLGRSVEELQEILEECGFVGEIIDKTKDLRYGDDGDCILRGNEILCWMKEHPVELGTAYWDYKEYVILDDDSDMLYWQKDNYIHCDPYCGITPNIVFQAKKILKGKEFNSLTD